jgi:hypothetical protein
MTKQVIYTLEDISTVFVQKAAGYAAYRYRHYGVTREDASQEALLWLYAREDKVNRWLAKSPQQTTRIYMDMLSAVLRYAEREKAAKAGYDSQDVMWYTVPLVEGLLPLALDDTYTGQSSSDDESGKRKPRQPNEGGDGLALVMDIRRALKGMKLTEFFYHHDSSHPLWDAKLEQLVDYLGGNSPFVGRRRPMSNAQAQFLTSTQGDA